MATSLQRLSKREAKLMRAVYVTQEKKIKKKLELALLKGNDTTYLENTLLSIGRDLRVLNNYNNYYTQTKLPLIFDNTANNVFEEAQSIALKFNTSVDFNRANRDSLVILAENTNKNLTETTKLIGRQANDYLRQIGLEQTSDVVFGSETWQKVARNMSEELKASNFFHVEYKNGAKVPSTAYSEMVARTTSAEASRQGSREQLDALDLDLIKVIGSSSDPNSPCIPYEGKTLSLSGKDSRYISLSEAVGAGLFHPNCIHDEGVSDDNYKNEES